MTLNKKDLTYFKDKLLAELAGVKKELETVGRINPDNPADWEALRVDMNIDKADKNDVADEIEEYEEHSAILKQLEIQYNQIKDALKKIDDGTYGICEMSGEEIPRERLEANPSARTKIEYANQRKQ